MKVKDILREKGSAVQTISPDHLISDAIAKLNEHKIGAMVVVDDDGKIQGIITERDVLRLAESHGGDFNKIKIREKMTEDLIIGVPDDDLNYVMNIMTENHIRHLPIVSEERLVGMISIGDILKARLDQCEFDARHLQEYITGKYPG